MSKNKSKKISSSDSAKLLEFLALIVDIEEIEVVGVVRFLGVKMTDEDGKLRKFEDTLSETLDKFISATENKKKEVLRIMNEAVRNKEKLTKEEVIN